MCEAYGEPMRGKIALMGEQRIEWNRLRSRAAQAVKRAIKNGRLADLKKSVVACVDCGNRATMYDHRDYSKPLEVFPVCGSCNIRRGTNAPTLLVVENFMGCPKCGSRVILYRARTDDYLCRRCGEVFKRNKK